MHEHFNIENKIINMINIRKFKNKIIWLNSKINDNFHHFTCDENILLIKFENKFVIIETIIYIIDYRNMK
jgi:hypothetical protein